MKIPFSPPYIGEDVINEVVNTLLSGWITTGPKVKALEYEISSLIGGRPVLCVNSWRSGAVLMLRWLGLKEGDEVIVPAYTYSATALAVMSAGAKPVMVDSGSDFNICVEAIRKAITPKTKVIIPVDFAGFPCDYDAIFDLVNDPAIKGLFVAESEVQSKLGRIAIVSDAAHSMGAWYSPEMRVGSVADVSVFSMHAVKNVTTAEGGAICLNLPPPFDNFSLYEELHCLSQSGQSRDAYTKTKEGSWRYDIVSFGMKINLPDLNASIGLAQMRQYGFMINERRRVFEMYDNFFGDKEWAVIPPSATDNRVTSYHIYALRIKGFKEHQRDVMIAEILKRGVSVNVHFIPMPMLTLFNSLGYDIKDYPQAFANYECEVSLPVYPQLSDDEVRYVANTVIEVCDYLKSGKQF